MAEATVKKTISLKPDIAKLLEDASRDTGLTQNAIIAAALRDYIALLPTAKKKSRG